MRTCVECGEPDNPTNALVDCLGCRQGPLCGRCWSRHDDLHEEDRLRAEEQRFMDAYPDRWLHEDA